MDPATQTICQSRTNSAAIGYCLDIRYVAPLTTEQRKTTLQAVVGDTNMIRSTLLLVVAAAIGGADAFAPVGMAARASTQLFMVSCYF
jgi:hypothetical protein